MRDPPARKTIDRVTPNCKTDSCVARWTAVWWLEASACVVCWDDPQYSVELSLWLNSNCSGAFDGWLLRHRILVDLNSWAWQTGRSGQKSLKQQGPLAPLFWSCHQQGPCLFLIIVSFFRLWIFYSLCIVSQTYHCMHSSCTGYSRKRHPSLLSSSRFQWRAVTAVSTCLSDFVESPSWLKKTQTIGIKQNKTDRSKRWSCASWSRALRWQRFGL